MSESKHTPGPWIDWETLEWLREPRRLLENTADARLIAAAPELLEALDELTDAIESGYTPQRHGSILRDARAAIAKAEGRS